jgi:hypothetical protein
MFLDRNIARKNRYKSPVAKEAPQEKIRKISPSDRQGARARYRAMELAE